MCPNKKILNQSKNGMLGYCPKSKLYQLIYNNLCFELYAWELDRFREYLSGLDITYWERELKTWISSRRIPIQVGTKHMVVMFNAKELNEILTLLGNKCRLPLLSLDEIDYPFIEN